LLERGAVSIWWGREGARSWEMGWKGG
jgi:hypothetical protein